MTAHPIPEHVRAAAVADYKASGDGYRAVAARHGISASRLNVLVNGKRPKRKPKTWGADEIGLTGGRWVNVRGVMRWEAFAGQPVDRQRRVEWEEAMFDEEEAREAHARYAYGHREPRIVVGERVYQRRKKRAQAARKAAA